LSDETISIFLNLILPNEIETETNKYDSIPTHQY